MCGIAGIIGENWRELHQSTKALTHRGPDFQSHIEFPEYNFALAHTRLKIIDLDPRSNQPFQSECGRYFLVFNGEIYNYKALKQSLVQSGVRFLTSSDTEVLLHWLIQHGADGLNDLDGMFAFCFFDRHKQRLLMARDPFGEKPFFYYYNSKTPGHFAFASELKALLHLDPDKKINQAMIADYIQFLYAPAPNTFYQNFYQLLPGHCIELNINEIELRQTCFWKPEDLVEGIPTEASGQWELLRKKFHALVESRLASDVPVSLLLSAGLDSNALLGAIAKSGHANEVTCFTAKYPSPLCSTGGDESQMAVAAAQFHKSKIHIVDFTENLNIEENLNTILQLFDQPYGNSTALVANRIFEKVALNHKVTLVGDVGDEIFSGYPRHHAAFFKSKMGHFAKTAMTLIRPIFNCLPEKGRFATPIRRIKSFLNQNSQSLSVSFLNWSTYLDKETTKNLCGSVDGSSFRTSLEELFNKYQDRPLLAASLVDLSSFVPYNLLHGSDSVGMFHSLETRTPFASKELARKILNSKEKEKIGSKKGNKPLLRIISKNIVPKEILNQPKRPFNPPLKNLLWSNRSYIRNVFDSNSSPIYKYLNKDGVKNQIDLFLSGQKDNSTWVWGILVLNKWLLKNGF